MKTVNFTKLLLLLAFVYFVPARKLSAQNGTADSYSYNNALGVRLGGTSGITFKHKFASQNAVEFIIGTYPHSIGLTGLYEHNVATNVNGLNLYFGGGAHIARSYSKTRLFYRNNGEDRYYYYKNEYGPIVGVDAIGGVEYKFYKVPIALSLDVKPMAEFYRGYGPYFSLDPGLGAKFTF